MPGYRCFGSLKYYRTIDNRYTHKTKVVKADDIEEIDIDSEK